MLKRLTIKNIALIEEVTLEFDSGMSVLSGETGAGKSVIVTGLALALGERADRQFVRHGARSGSVGALFDVSEMPESYRRQFENFIDDNVIEISRRISTDGNGRVQINGENATLTQLRALMTPVAEILSQHANQQLMDESNHLSFLDRYGSLEPKRDDVAQAFELWQRVASELKRTVGQRDRLQQERELLLFQRDEIEKAQIQIGEEEKLLTERKLLDSARTLMTSADSLQSILGGDERSVEQALSMAAIELDRMAKIDEKLSGLLAEFDSLRIGMEELRRSVEEYGGSIVDDPHRLEEINVRLDELYNLKRKYGGSEEAVLNALAVITTKLSDRPDTDRLIETLEQENEQLMHAYAELSVALSEDRSKASKRLKKQVVKELRELAIDNGGFEFEFLYELNHEGILLNGKAVQPFVHGLENGRILFSANKGEPLKSLVRTASGGEISRVLLALKSAEQSGGRLPQSLMVFDEVDAGIGGRTAIEVGKKLRKLSADRQLLVITHLHQIAREADHHYVVEKSNDKSQRATITVSRLDTNGKKQELKRMVALPE